MSCDVEYPEEGQQWIPMKSNQVPLQRGDSLDKERGGRHLPANHKLRGSELAATTAACNSTTEPGQQQARYAL
ncbi:hypothetical protein KPH14_002725 [Odynerus spinipes]|uniref:Uncharacterized protein n=1 Tax=Odynerus spinipes TaxID=1348599 RepID=A0AAD9VPJ9_9HYME|nr:hypothetical protein KPH14_002725 [Odynerus spinipes]